MKLVTVASIQPPFNDVKSRSQNEIVIDRGLEYLEYALENGAQFCCLPEVFNVFGVSDADYGSVCDNSDGVLGRVQSLTDRFDSYVIVPLLVHENGRYYNRAYISGPKGSIIGHYDKIHITQCEKDSLDPRAGTEIPVFQIGEVRIAIAICYDLYFPEFFSVLTKHEPDIIFIPSLQRSDHEPANEGRLQTRATDTMAYIVRSSFGCPGDEAWKPGMMFGQSCIVHPDGTILANAGHYEGIAIAHMTVPFDWKRQRCGGKGAQSVRSFLREDRENATYSARIITVES